MLSRDIYSKTDHDESQCNYCTATVHTLHKARKGEKTRREDGAE